jgi:hypothetical protein
MQPDPSFYLNREQRDRQAKLDERSLEHRRLLAEARHHAAAPATAAASLTVAGRLRALFGRRFANLRGCPPEARL